MKIILQRCTSASVSMNNETRNIQQGYVLLLGVMADDNEDDADKLIQKILNVRLFTNNEGKINDLSIQDISGDILVVSQFTLAGTLKKGNRPDYTTAMEPNKARELYEYVIAVLQKNERLGTIETGEFGAYMQVTLVNDGPVTLVLDSTSL
jgi:D-tyrosyl-tRNA(Tyr) deacylase